jgi:hypothetical protein
MRGFLKLLDDGIEALDDGIFGRLAEGKRRAPLWVKLSAIALFVGSLVWAFWTGTVNDWIGLGLVILFVLLLALFGRQWDRWQGNNKDGP